MTFQHKDIRTISQRDGFNSELLVNTLEEGFAGVLYFDGDLCKVLDPGRHVCWRKSADIKVLHVDLRESVLDVSGQEIITKDKVTLRLNGLAERDLEN